MPYVVEHAKSGRALCKTCGALIPLGALRLGSTFSISGSYTSVAYRHFPRCLTQRVAQNVHQSGGDVDVGDLSQSEEDAFWQTIEAYRVDASKLTPTARRRAKSNKASPAAEKSTPGSASKSKAKSRSPRAAQRQQIADVVPLRIPLVSLLVDALYGSTPAPFFVLESGELSPDAMMRMVPGWLLAIVSLGIGIGLAAVASTLSPTLGVAAFVPVAVHWFLFAVHGYPYSSEKLFDLAGQVGFTLMSFYSFSVTTAPVSPRNGLVCAWCLIWSLRLGWYLFSRFLERGEDWRFVKARKHPGYHFFAWTMQGVWCFFQGLCLLALNEWGSSSSAPLGGPLDVVGTLVWAISLTVESVSDMQKLAFVRRYEGKKNRPWIQEGLWAYSRHPNFAGETGCWIGIFLICLGGLPMDWRVALAAGAPIWSMVFLQQTTVPWLEVLADRKYGHAPGYAEYKRATSAYFLMPKRPSWV